MKSYYAYIRVSTVKQGEHGSSLQEQKSAIETYAARHDLRISAWFEERETAAKQGRREFSRMTGLLRAGKAAGVVIHKIDRSARNLRDWAGLGELIDAGVEVLFAHEALDLTTRGGRLAADIQAVVAADFIRNLRDEVRKGFYGRLKQGYYPLRAPRGYLDRGKCQPKAICPITGQLVAQAFELYASGEYSLDRLRHEMAKRGLTSGATRPLSLDAISLMLHNPFYIGLMRIRSQTFEGKHTALVSKALFDRVQAIMDGRLYPRVEKHAFLFRRLVRCGQCGRTLTGERQKGHVYYRCHDRACRRVCVSHEIIESEFGAALQSLTLDERDMGDLRDLLGKEIAHERVEEHDAQAQLERELALVEKRLVRLTDLLIDGAIDPASFEKRKAGLLGQRIDLKERAERGGDVTFWRVVAERFERASAAYLGYQSGTDEEKRAMVELLSSNLVVADKKPVISLHFPFDEISKWTLSHQGGPYQGAVRTGDRPARRAARRRQAPISKLLGRIGRLRRQCDNRTLHPFTSPTSPKSPRGDQAYALSE